MSESEGHTGKKEERILEWAERLPMPVVILFIFSELMEYMGWPYWQPVLLFALALAVLQWSIELRYAEKGSGKRRWAIGSFAFLFLLAVLVLLSSQDWL